MHVWYFLERGVSQFVSSRAIVATTKAGFDEEVRSGHFPRAGGGDLEVDWYCTCVQGNDLVDVGVVGVVK